MVIEALRSLLEEKGHDVVGVVSDGRALLATAPALKPDVVILDVSMPLMNGLDAAERLKQLLPNVKIVFLTMKDDPNLVAAVLSLGPVGYVLKHSAGSELLSAITEVLRGRSYVPPRLKPENWAVRETALSTSQRT
jgi:DNA-binding NarL/FixJ family response regulator